MVIYELDPWAMYKQKKEHNKEFKNEFKNEFNNPHLRLQTVFDEIIHFRCVQLQAHSSLAKSVI